MASSPGVINSPESSCEVTNTLVVAEHFSIIPDASTRLRVIEDNRFAQKKELRTVKRKYRNLLKRFHDSEEARCEAQRECREMALKYTIRRQDYDSMETKYVEIQAALKAQQKEQQKLLVTMAALRKRILRRGDANARIESVRDAHAALIEWKHYKKAKSLLSKVMSLNPVHRTLNALQCTYLSVGGMAISKYMLRHLL